MATSTAALAAVLAAGLLGVAASPPPAAAAPNTLVASPLAPVPPSPGMSQYVDPAGGWSINYPTGWQVDASDPTFVKIQDPGDQVLVGVHVATARSPLPVAVDKILASQENYRRQNGQTWSVVNRQPISLADGTEAVDVLVEMGPGGRARELYAVKGGKVFGIDAETYVTSWDTFSADFDRILMSFAPPA